MPEACPYNDARILAEFFKPQRLKIKHPLDKKRTHHGASLLIIYYLLLVYNYFAHLVALTTDEDTVFGICNLDTLEVEIFNICGIICVEFNYC